MKRLCFCRVALDVLARMRGVWNCYQGVTGSSPVGGAKRKQIERSAFSFGSHHLPEVCAISNTVRCSQDGATQSVVDEKKEPEWLFFWCQRLKTRSFRSEERARETTMFFPCRPRCVCTDERSLKGMKGVTGSSPVGWTQKTDSIFFFWLSCWSSINSLAVSTYVLFLDWSKLSQ